jgi:hypothetical protein
MTNLDQQLEFPDGWCYSVGIAIGQPTTFVKALVSNLWKMGQSIAEIQNHLKGLAAINGKQLFFSPPGLS